MQRSIPVTYSGITEQVALYEKPVPTWTPPINHVNLSHHIEPPSASEAREWAWGALVGGAILASGIDIIAVFGAVTTRHMFFACLFVSAWLLPAVGYLTPLVIRFKLRHQFDTRVREAMPAPKTYTTVKGKASHVIEARVIEEPGRNPDREAHLHKLCTLALWAASETPHDDGTPKKYGYAPRFRRDGKGTRQLWVEAIGEWIKQEAQADLYADLERVKIFTKHGDEWGLVDLTWTPEKVISRMEAAFPND